MEQKPEKKKMGLIPKILAGLGVLFIIIMLLPDDDTSTEEGRSLSDADVESQGDSGAAYANIESVSVGTDAKSATIMVYVNGSDLESQWGEASGDIGEMVASGIGENVNVILQTMGTKEWQNYGISSSTAQTYRIEDGELKLIRDDLGQLNCGEKSTLSEFISFCKNNYPAERYMFLFWDHGGGPVYGFGYDEWQAEGESLTLAEMASAFAENNDIHFDIIGMDCCIMASMETCYALAPYAKYALLSEDFESGLGWSYTNWMREFENNPGISTPVLGKYIVDDIIKDNENVSGGDSACMALFNLSTSKSLYSAWKTYAYKNESALLNKNYSKSHRAKGRGFFDQWLYDDSDVTLADYYISDILAITESIDKDSDEAKSLISALKAAVAYYGHTSDKNELTGLAVSLPYGDAEFYSQLKSVYTDIGLDSEYVEWLGGFVKSSGYSDYYDYDSFENSWGGWGDYESEYGGNISSGASCEYSYDYDSAEYYGYEDEYAGDDWIYDCEEQIWYCYEDGAMYLYDDQSEITYYYDESSGEVYYYDDSTGEWQYME